MSLIKANAVQVGQSPTATQNFTLAVPSSPDGTIKLARGNSGATTQDVLSVDASGNINGLVKSTGSTAARSLANRFADVVNVKDFGAVGDGVADDTAAIQAAINSGAKEVFIPSGTYIVSTFITLRGNLKLHGCKDSIVKLINNCPVIPGAILDYSIVSTIYDLEISGFTVDGNRLNNWQYGPKDAFGNEIQQTNLQALISVRSVIGLTISNMKLINSRRDALWVTNCIKFNISENICNDFCNSGIAIRNDTTAINNTKHGVVANNICSGGVCGLHGLFAIENVTFEGNVAFNNRDQNRFVYGYSGTYPNVWPSTGGYLPAGSPNYKSPANVGDGAGIEFTTSPLDAIIDPQNRYCAVVGNTTIDNAHGIRLESSSKYITITGNTCIDNDYHGIFIFACQYVSICGNIASFNYFAGIQIERPLNSIVIGTTPELPNHNTITSNTIEFNGGFGIALISSSWNSIDGNNLRSNNANNSLGGGIGMFESDAIPCTNNTINSNIIRNNAFATSYAIYTHNIAATTGNNIASNNIGPFPSGQIINLGYYTNNIFKNTGYATTNYFSAVIPQSSTSVVVTHSMPYTPNVGQIFVTPFNNMAGASFWISNVTSTTFTINSSTSAPVGGFGFNWAVIDRG